MPVISSQERFRCQAGAYHSKVACYLSIAAITDLYKNGTLSGECRLYGKKGSVQLKPLFTRSLSSFPGLKWGTYFPLNSTFSPVFGLRPIRGAR